MIGADLPRGNSKHAETLVAKVLEEASGPVAGIVIEHAHDLIFGRDV